MTYGGTRPHTVGPPPDKIPIDEPVKNVRDMNNAELAEWIKNFNPPKDEDPPPREIPEPTDMTPWEKDMWYQIRHTPDTSVAEELLEVLRRGESKRSRSGKTAAQLKGELRSTLDKHGIDLGHLGGEIGAIVVARAGAHVVAPMITGASGVDIGIATARAQAAQGITDVRAARGAGGHG